MNRNKKAVMRMLCFTMAFIVGIGFTTIVAMDPAAAASKKKVYLVKSIKIKQDGKTTTKKIQYNKKGLITKITDPRISETQTFTYDKKGQLKKWKETYKGAKGSGTQTRTYTWKKGKLVKTNWIEKGKVTDVTTYKHNKKGQIINAVTKWSDPSGIDGTTITMYKYKKGHIVQTKINNEVVLNFTLDKKGNVKKHTMTMNGKLIKDGYSKASHKYKKGRLVKMHYEGKNPMMPAPEKSASTFKYKKVKTSKKYLKTIKEQQWHLINISGESFAW